MYGKSPVEFPRRIVCLTAEHVEICYALGAGDRVVGVPGTARRPTEAAAKSRVGGFTTFRVDRILELEPDLILAFSDLQADISAELIRAGLPVFCANPRSVEEVMRTILTVGGLLGAEPAARALVLDMRDEITQVREFTSGGMIKADDAFFLVRSKNILKELKFDMPPSVVAFSGLGGCRQLGRCTKEPARFTGMVSHENSQKACVGGHVSRRRRAPVWQ